MRFSPLLLTLPSSLVFLLLICWPALGAADSAPSADEAQVAGALRRGDFTQAIAMAKQGLEKGQNASLRDLLGRAYAASGDGDGAARELRTAVRLQPDSEQFQFDLGQFLLRSQNFPEALEALREAHRRLPNSAQIELALGVADYCSTRYDEAVRAFLRTMDLAPDAPQPYRFLGNMLEHADSHLAEIARRCAEEERRDPANAGALLLHARVLIEEHSKVTPSEDKLGLETAAHLLEKALALDVRSAGAYFTLGCLMADEGNLEQAADLLRKSLALNPADAGTHYRLGLIYARLGDRGRADGEFAAQAALKQKPHGLPLE